VFPRRCGWRSAFIGRQGCSQHPSSRGDVAIQSFAEVRPDIYSDQCRERNWRRLPSAKRSVSLQAELNCEPVKNGRRSGGTLRISVRTAGWLAGESAPQQILSRSSGIAARSSSAAMVSFRWFSRAAVPGRSRFPLSRNSNSTSDEPTSHWKWSCYALARKRHGPEAQPWARARRTKGKLLQRIREEYDRVARENAYPAIETAAKKRRGSSPRVCRARTDRSHTARRVQ